MSGQSSRGGVVAVHAHPDDETLTSGALLATAAAAGLPATVVTCTRGERGEVIGAEHHALEGDGPALARHREAEIATAMRALGGAAQVFLDQLPGPDRRYVDSGMAWIDGLSAAGAAADLPEGALVAAELDETAGRLAAWLRERRPDLLVADEPGGGYGHPDHLRAHRIVLRATELLGDDAPALAWAVDDAAELRSARSALAEDPLVAQLIAEHAAPSTTRQGPFSLPDPTGVLPAMARTAPGAGFTVPVAPVRSALLAALAAHATQVQAVTALDGPAVVGCYALSNGALAPVLPVERYEWADPERTAPVPAAQADAVA
nr:PIG-L family deacetylase [Cellulomonas sp. RIT-PI-Y]